MGCAPATDDGRAVVRPRRLRRRRPQPGAILFHHATALPARRAFASPCLARNVARAWRRHSTGLARARGATRAIVVHLRWWPAGGRAGPARRAPGSARRAKDAAVLADRSSPCSSVSAPMRRQPRARSARAVADAPPHARAIADDLRATHFQPRAVPTSPSTHSAATSNARAAPCTDAWPGASTRSRASSAALPAATSAPPPPASAARATAP